MKTDISTLPPSLSNRIQPVLHAAEQAGCTFVLVHLETDVGFTARIQCPGVEEPDWLFQAHEFNYLMGHMRQHIEQLTP